MGSRIKSVAIILIVLGVIACVICFFVGNSAYQKDKDCIKYATVNGGAGYGYSILEEAGNRAYAGQMLRTYSIYGIIGSIFGGLPLYWFGCLFEHVEITREIAEENKRKIDHILRILNNDSSKNIFERTPNIRRERTSESTGNENPTHKDVT